MLRIQSGLVTYCEIMNWFKETDVSKDYKFQRRYKGFYRVRRDDDWAKIYFDYFQKVKNTNITFKEIINYLFEQTGRVEASFASKMLATINPNMPIWDQEVLDKLGFKQTYQYNKDKQLKDAIDNYERIVNWYKDNITSNYIEEFDTNFPDYKHISKVKKIDFILWGVRNKKNKIKVANNDVDSTYEIAREIEKLKEKISNSHLNDDQLAATIEALEDLIKYFS